MVLWPQWTHAVSRGMKVDTQDLYLEISMADCPLRVTVTSS